MLFSRSWYDNGTIETFSFARFNFLRLFSHFVKLKLTNVANEVVKIVETNIAHIFNNRSYCWSTLNLVL